MIGLRQKLETKTVYIYHSRSPQKNQYFCLFRDSYLLGLSNNKENNNKNQIKKVRIINLFLNQYTSHVNHEKSK